VDGPARVDVLWLPLGAGGHSVRINGRVWEALSAWRDGRARCDLYHAALRVHLPEGRFTIEQAPVPAGDPAARGVAVEGPVVSPLAGRLRVFRYEIRCWRDGVIPDAADAVGEPVTVTRAPGRARAVVALVPEVPPPWCGAVTPAAPGRCGTPTPSSPGCSRGPGWMRMPSHHRRAAVRPAGGRGSSSHAAGVPARRSRPPGPRPEAIRSRRAPGPGPRRSPGPPAAPAAR